MTEKKETLGSLGLLMAALIWGGSYVIGKSLVLGFHPVLSLWLRYILAAGAMSVVFHKKMIRARRSAVRSGIILGAILCVAQSLQMFANLYTSSGKVGFLTIMYVLWMPFISWAVDKKRPDIRTALAVIVSFAGVYILAFYGNGSVNRGDILVIFASVIHACHIFLSNRFVQRDDSLSIAVFQFIAAFLVCTVILLACGEDIRDISELNRIQILQILYQGIMGVMMGFSIQTVCLRYVKPSSATILLAMQAVFAMIISVIVGYDELNAKTIAGCVLIFSAILILQVKRTTVSSKSGLSGSE